MKALLEASLLFTQQSFNKLIYRYVRTDAYKVYDYAQE